MASKTEKYYSKTKKFPDGSNENRRRLIGDISPHLVHQMSDLVVFNGSMTSMMRGKIGEEAKSKRLGFHPYKGKRPSQYDEQKEFCILNFVLRSSVRSVKVMNLEESNIEDLRITDLVEFEKQLTGAIIQTRTRKTQLMMDSISTLNDQERMLAEQNKLLEIEIAAAANNVHGGNEVDSALADDPNSRMACLPQHPML
ncbi:Transcription factor, K-box [Dillenia turbinata]|uniref:Transcription factor, K-box n=1 Tax=Dillenia turbinata TaxID=194707 RepID=A0AAN8VC94_9MAGN